VLSNPDRAIELVLEAMREQPHNGVWRSLYALLLSRAGRACEASKQYRLAIADVPSHLRPKLVERAKEAREQCQP
jgi:Flp pilus assembly protein TadD